MTTCRFGILGAGKIAAHFCNAVKAVNGAEVVAVASTSCERARDFAEKNSIPQYYASYEEMLNHADINIVYIATTHNFHMDDLRLCFEHGMNVLCEKPMVLTADDAREAFRMAKEKRLFCMEAMWSRFLPQYQKAREWIVEGKIGKLQSVSAVIAFKADSDPTGRLLNPKLAGGAMYDIGVYPIEAIGYLIGEPIESCMGKWRPAPTGVDERATFILQFPSCDAAVQCLFTSNAKEYVIVNGSDGYIELPFVSGGHKIMRYDANRRLEEEFTEPFENGFVYEIEEVVRCIAQGKLYSEIMPPEATIACAEVFDQILRG